MCLAGPLPRTRFNQPLNLVEWPYRLHDPRSRLRRCGRAERACLKAQSFYQNLRIKTPLEDTSVMRMLSRRCVVVAAGLCLLLGWGNDARADLLVSSRDSDSILRFDQTNGAFLGTFVTAGSGGLSQPVGMRLGPDGSLFVSSFGTNQILKYDGKTGAYQGVFVSGPSLSNPADLRFGSDGSLYVANFGDATVTRYDGTTGALLDTYTGPDLSQPTSVLFDGMGRLLVSSFGTDKILRLDASSSSFVPFASSGVLGPSGLAIGPDANLYVASLLGFEVRKYDIGSGADLGAFASTGDFSYPSDVLFDLDGRLLVTSLTFASVLGYDGVTGAAQGVFAGGNGLNLPAQLLLIPVPEPSSALLALCGASVLFVWKLRTRPRASL